MNQATEKRHEQMLSWFVDRADARDAVNGNFCITSDIVLKSVPDSVLDSQVIILDIESYCTEDIFNKIKEAITKRRKHKQWKCGICKEKLIGRSIACDHCLCWCHFSCTSLNKKPTGDWFCAVCIQENAKGNQQLLF